MESSDSTPNDEEVEAEALDGARSARRQPDCIFPQNMQKQQTLQII
jgi:hypothetical protein